MGAGIVGLLILCITLVVIGVAINVNPIAKTYARNCVSSSNEHRNTVCLPELVKQAGVLDMVTNSLSKLDPIPLDISLDSFTWDDILSSTDNQLLQQIIHQVITPSDPIHINMCQLNIAQSKPILKVYSHEANKIDALVEHIGYQLTGMFVLPFNPPDTTDPALFNEVMETLLKDIPRVSSAIQCSPDKKHILHYNENARELYWRFKIVATDKAGMLASAELEYKWKYALGLPIAPVMIEPTSNATGSFAFPVTIDRSSLKVELSTCEDVQSKRCKDLEGLLCNSVLCDSNVRGKLESSIAMETANAISRLPESERVKKYDYSKDEIQKLINKHAGKVGLLLTSVWLTVITLIVVSAVLMVVGVL